MVDLENQESNNLEQLRKAREETTNRWNELGLLDKLSGLQNKNLASIFECCPSYIIKNDEENKD